MDWQVVWERARAIYEAACDMEGERRRSYIEAACAGEASLFAQVEEMFRLHDGLAHYITGASRKCALSDDEPGLCEEEPAPRTTWRIVRRIAQGGMGAVYLAEQFGTDFRRPVALKLLHPDFDAELLARRLRLEGQILARLDHPNIARLIDGGQTRDGRPYLLMDYIEGEPIDRYCQSRQLGLPERLRLFEQVCAAVSYAHQRLVVHRDIKPANILVTTDGQPKLLDFGVAKLLDDQTRGNTETAAWAFTPRYASPEQFQGEPVTTATDVYSLGVLLYELLSGCHPYPIDDRSPLAYQRAVCFEEPRPPSAAVGAERQKLGRQLRGDLDNIVLMALRKEPSRRYASVEQLSDDIRRHLEGLPVRARKDTPSYRLSRFVKRNRLVVGATALLVFSLAGGTLATLHQANLARQHFDEVRSLANAFLFEFEEAIREIPGTVAARKLLVTRALEYLDRLASQAEGDRDLQAELARAYQKVGDLQGRPDFANLGDTMGAIASYRKALAIREELVAANPAQPQLRSELADTLRWLGRAIQDNTAQPEVGEGYLRRAVTLREALVRAEPYNGEWRWGLLADYYHFSYFLMQIGKLTEARPYTERGLSLATAWLAQTDAPPKARILLSVFNLQMGDMLGGSHVSNLGDYQGALTYFQAFERLAARVVQLDPNNSTQLHNLAVAHERIGNMLAKLGRYSEALDSYNRALAMHQHQATDLHNTAAQIDLLLVDAQIAKSWKESGRPERALLYYRRMQERARRVLQAHPDNALASNTLIWSQGDVADCLALRGRRAEALRLYETALPQARKLAPPGSQDLWAMFGLADLLYGRAQLLQALGRPQVALVDLQQGLALYARVAQAHPENAVAQRAVGRFYASMAVVGQALTLRDPSYRQQTRTWSQNAVALFARIQRSGKLSAQEEQLLKSTSEILASSGTAAQRSES